MIAGVGTDIVQIARMERLWRQHGERLVRHVLAPGELPDPPPQDMGRFLAKRFAAKEAFAKAAGTGLRTPVSLSSLSVVHDGLGRPSFAFAAPLQEWLSQRGVRASHLSVSDERDMAVAFVVLEGRV